MEFNSLSEKCEYYRKQTDYRLPLKSYGIIMVDGKNFSTKWKNKLNKPFDSHFIQDMNEVAKYLCSKIDGATFAFVQSDEISIAFNDLKQENTTMYFDGRLCKIQSVVASMAATKFNQLRLIDALETENKYAFNLDYIKDFHLSDFDCRVWTVPNVEDQISWFFYRQNDCVRNSILQMGFTYFSHKQLMNKKTDEILEMTKDRYGIDWNNYKEGEKYGRIVRKISYETPNTYISRPATIIRTKWEVFDGFDFNLNKDKIREFFIHHD